MLGNWVYESERSKFPMKVVNIDKDMVYLDFEGNDGEKSTASSTAPTATSTTKKQMSINRKRNENKNIVL